MTVLINLKICDNVAECGGIEACPTGALFWDEKKEKIGIDNSKCTNCGLCVRACPVQAIHVAKTEEEYEKIKKEIKEDPRKISDLFVDRYGAMPIDPDTLMSSKDFKKLSNLTKPVVVEFFNDDSIECLRRSIPVKNLMEHKDILFKKVNLEDDALKSEFNVKELPALLLFNKDNLIGKIEGYVDSGEEQELKKKLGNLIKKLD